MRLHRDVDLEVERLARARVDDRARALRPHEEAADLLQRVLRRGQPDALHLAAGLLGEALERDRQVRAALGLRDGVDLVDDHLLRALEDLARLRGEHQVERLGRRDEDVGRVADHVAPLLLRRVARADADLHGGADAAQRRAQVLLHVVGERLEGRDVDEPRPVGAGLGHQPVERPQEGGERLARAGRGGDQRVLARGDRRPRLRLRRGRLGERAREPLPDLRGEGGEGRDAPWTLRRYPRTAPADSAANHPCAHAGASAAASVRRRATASAAPVAAASAPASSGARQSNGLDQHAADRRAGREAGDQRGDRPGVGLRDRARGRDLAGELVARGDQRRDAESGGQDEHAP